MVCPRMGSVSSPLFFGFSSPSLSGASSSSWVRFWFLPSLLCPARLVLRWPQPLPFCFRPRSSPQLPPCFPNAFSAGILPKNGCRGSHCPNRPCFCGEIELGAGPTGFSSGSLGFSAGSLGFSAGPTSPREGLGAGEAAPAPRPLLPKPALGFGQR